MEFKFRSLKQTHKDYKLLTFLDKDYYNEVIRGFRAEEIHEE